MDKKIVGLVGAMSAVALLDTAQASTVEAPEVAKVMSPQSFEDLLAPIPNAVSVLRAVDAVEASAARAAMESGGGAKVKLAQYYGYDGYYYHHHHHHHHHHNYYPYHPYAYPYPTPYPYPYYRHHHHHHHHQYYDGYQ